MRGIFKLIYKYMVENLSGIEIGDSMEYMIVKVFFKGKVKVIIDLIFDEEDENDEMKFGFVSVCYLVFVNVYFVWMRLF